MKKLIVCSLFFLSGCVMYDPYYTTGPYQAVPYIVQVPHVQFREPVIVYENRPPVVIHEYHHYYDNSHYYRYAVRP